MYSADVGVVGLGYVGLTLATAMADIGLRVVGIEKRADVVELVKSGTPPFQEVGLQAILQRVVGDGTLEVRADFLPEDSCPVYIITVGTPLDADGEARLDMVENATRQVAESMPEGALVVLRSTVKIGTCRNVVRPVLEASGKAFQLAMCPERTLEGNAMAELRQLPQIVGADERETRERAARLFSQLTPQVLTVSSLETAEVIKLADNTFRDVRFGFANEIARLCDAIGVSANEVIATGKLGYPRTNIAQPGLVGGPCLEKDPHIFCQSAAQYGIDLEITRAARTVNERQPAESVGFILDELARRGHAGTPAVAILGLAFKGVPETDDLRGAMSLRVIEALKQRAPEAALRAYDPVVGREAAEALGLGLVMFDDPLDALDGADVAIIANNHPLFASLSVAGMAARLKPDGFVYDFWNHLGDSHADLQGAHYFSVGSVRRQPR